MRNFINIVEAVESPTVDAVEAMMNELGGVQSNGWRGKTVELLCNKCEVRIVRISETRAEIDSIFVPERYRGIGIATIALKKVIASADKWGVVLQLTIHCMSGDGEHTYLDNSDLESWYIRQGFVYHGDDYYRRAPK